MEIQLFRILNGCCCCCCCKILETPPLEVKQGGDQRIEEENNSTNIIQTYISTNQIIDHPTLENNGVFEHETHVEGSDTINVIGETTVVENHISILNDETTFKKPFDAPPPPQPQSILNQRPIGNTSENVANSLGKATREIISCFMTTSGFISPAREGKLPEAKKPIIIQEDPEPEEIEIKQRTPSPEPIERKHHSNKRDRDNKTEHFDTSKNYGNDAMNPRHIDATYADDENGKEVKLYEVIQTVPDAPQKKKTKKSQLDIAQMKEQKKQKKLQQLKANRNQSKLNAVDAAYPFDGDYVKTEGDGIALDSNKLKKDLRKMKMLHKKHKQKPIPFAGDQEVAEKQRKKRISKLSKKNLQAMGLNPNAIEGFAIPMEMQYSIHEPNASQDTMKFNVNPKENVKKNMKQLQKLSNEPDKQKIKFFKKLSSTSSNLLSKMNEARDHEMDRMLDSSNLPGNESNYQMAHGFNAGDDGAQFNATVPNMNDLNRLASNLGDLPPSKKQKLLKKMNKPLKEPKTPKIKKDKKDPLAKKQRAPKIPKLEAPAVMPPTNLEENPLTKMFLPPDEFRPNVGLMDQFPVPGLNPLNPLFQSVRFNMPARDQMQQMQNYPFVPGLQNFDFANLSRFKRPNFNDPMQNDMENLSKPSREVNNPPPKPLCNVAPLMPPSLLNMEMQPGDYMQSTSMHEPHSSQKHYPDPMSSSFASKKNLSFGNPPYPYGGADDSPIVINSDDDDKIRSNPSQSPPGLEPDQSFGGGGEVKRKKVKDKKDKEKKEKKDKETGVIKIKKKKDKKDKSKNKGEHSKPPKDKSALKKEKREKKKERERSAAALSMDTNDSMATSNPFYGSQTHSEWPRDSFAKDTDHTQIGDSSDINATFNTDNSNLETTTIPKLTLKLGPSSSSPSSRTSRPSTPDFPINKKR